MIILNHWTRWGPRLQSKRIIKELPKGQEQWDLKFNPPSHPRNIVHNHLYKHQPFSPPTAKGSIQIIYIYIYTYIHQNKKQKTHGWERYHDLANVVQWLKGKRVNTQPYTYHKNLSVFCFQDFPIQFDGHSTDRQSITVRNLNRHKQ